MEGIRRNIKKGVDSYVYLANYGEKYSKETEKEYKYKKDVNKNWIVHVEEEASISLKKIFKVRQFKSLDVLIEYALKKYYKSLKLELIRINKEIKLIGDKYEIV